MIPLGRNQFRAAFVDFLPRFPKNYQIEPAAGNL